MDTNPQQIQYGIHSQFIGIGVADGQGKNTGPLAITQDFGVQSNFKPYLLGVVYRDTNGDGYYSQGEGLAGVSLTIAGPAGTFTTTTSAAGGYQLQVPAGTYTVTVGGIDFGLTQTATVTVGSQNVRHNFIAPALIKLTGPTAVHFPVVGLGFTADLSWTAVPGAAGYRLYGGWQSPPNPSAVEKANFIIPNDGSLLQTTSYSFTNMSEGTYWFSVVAYNASGQAIQASNQLVTNVVSLLHKQKQPGRLGEAGGAFSHSAEYYTNVITAAYRRYLGRDPEPEGLSAWLDALQHGYSDEQLEAGFIGSPEFIQDSGGPGAPWIVSLYEKLLGRDPEAAGLQGWLAALQNGTSPAAIAYGFAASAEREAQRITADYQTYLGRLPESQDIINQWVSAFESGVSNEDVVAGFVGSPEYFETHGSTDWGWLRDAYQDVLGRQPDDAGFQEWLNFLANS
jgi:hypothetical protein